MSAPTSPARRILAGGLSVHPIGIGAWALGGCDHNLGLPMGWSTADDAASRRGLERAYELGANLIDTADVYGHGHSERIIGDFTATVERDTVVLSSKVGYHRGTARHPYLPSAMRRQLETTLENLRTDHLDIYFFHNADFGPDDRYLEAAITQMHDFQRQGLITAVGMRGPHRYATERVTIAKELRGDKYARFTQLAQQIRPHYLAARYNALTPPPADGRPDIFTLASSLGASVLINKPLAQGLLTGKYDPDRPPVFAPGDHRLRKAWFTPGALKIIQDGLAPLRERFGDTSAALTRVALQYCLQQTENAAVLVGFTRPEQVTENLTAVGTPLTADELTFVSGSLGRLQQNLDAAGEVFLDEKGASR
ncbi:aldo/keto reductase [Streptomyces sp. NPDC020489]|uniref:aldo/keto reductase n=1 Tax=Streptomyces sp. NPDC020489 TaxID=3365077 RepID=UPI0037AFD251